MTNEMQVTGLKPLKIIDISIGFGLIRTLWKNC
jgi:hypothetical protein